MTQIKREDRYGRPITLYELPVLSPLRRDLRGVIPEQNAQNSPSAAVLAAIAGGSGGCRTRKPAGSASTASRWSSGPVLMFIGKVRR